MHLSCVNAMFCQFLLPFFSCILISSQSTIEIPNYCSTSCDGIPHTACLRKLNCKPVNGCLVVPQDAKFREKMVEAHNVLRNNIASGETAGPYGNTGAKNMRSLSYDMELEFIAECWASLCPGFKNDDCRDTERFPVGQNIFYARNIEDPKDAVFKWFQGMSKATSPVYIKRYPFFAASTKEETTFAHFSQVIWANTEYIGCAWAKFGPDNSESLIVCNYGPAGNVKDLPIYRMAQDPLLIASDCEEGKNPLYRSLCGCVKRAPEGRSWAEEYEPEAEKKMRGRGGRIRGLSLRLLSVILSVIYGFNKLEL